MGYLWAFIAGAVLMGALMDYNRITNKKEEQDK